MTDHGQEGAHGEHHAHPPYVKIYVVLVVLFVISVLGPEVADMVRAGGDGSAEDAASRAKIAVALVLVTAFGIAIVKAVLVGGYFMHLKFEPAFARYLLYAMMAFLLVFFAGVAPDVMKHEGANWVHPNVVPEIASGHHDDGHGDDHGDAHGDEAAAQEAGAHH